MREARRMIGDFVKKENEIQGAAPELRPIEKKYNF